MFVKIPFESEIKFKNNIKEITKMSLEHDFNISGEEVLGNFYISGEYKSHEVSVNTEPFKYTLPFTVELRHDIDRESLEFNIEDFSYDIINNNTLKVNIEYSLQALEKEEELFERVNEDDLSEELQEIDNFLDKEKEVKEEVTNIVEDNIKEDNRLDKEEEKTIMDTIKSSDDTFVTYHIHIVKESETLESISKIYNITTNDILEYNNIDSISIGDKIVIPSNIDE